VPPSAVALLPVQPQVHVTVCRRLLDASIR
jgi:hypothetical protein